MISTTAAVVEEPGAPFAVQDVALDEPRPGEVLVRMVAAGLCHTDLGVQAGGIPFRLRAFSAMRGRVSSRRPARPSPRSSPATRCC